MRAEQRLPYARAVTESGASLIELHNISKTYKSAGGETPALDSVALAFGGSGLVCVLGESGCGKTTLLNIMGGMDEPTSGDVTVCGKPLSDFTEREKNAYRSRSVGFVFQSGDLVPDYTAEENVVLACRLAAFPDAEERAVSALRAVGMESMKDKRPGGMSGGQRQRVAIARAVAKDPDVILADEPTGSLDPASGEEVVGLLKELSAARLVVMVTHNRELAEKYADRIIEIDSGRIVSDSDPRAFSDVARLSAPAPSPSAAFPLKLGAKNAVRRKGRSALMSFICMIGAFCVAAVIAFAGGAYGFVDAFERSTLRSYPVIAGEGAYDITELMTDGYTPDISRLTDDVYVRTYLSELYFRVTDGVPVSEEFLDCVSAMNDDLCAYIHYDYRLDYDSHVFTAVKIGSTELNVSLSYINDYSDRFTASTGVLDALPDVFSPLPESRDVVLGSCELVYGEYPDGAGEMALVIDEDYGIDEYVLALTGYYSTDEIDAYFSGDTENSRYGWSYEELTGKRFALFSNDVIYRYRSSSDTFAVNNTFSPSVRPLTEISPGDGTELKITGVLRRTDDSAPSCGLYYDTALDGELLELSAESEVVGYVQNAYEQRGVYADPLTGDALPEKQGLTMLRSIGGCSLPGGVEFYASSVEAKDEITAYLAAWNEGHYDLRVPFADNTAAIASYAEGMIGSVAGVLASIAALVAVASALLLAAVTALSARERRGEFRLLRSLGASRGTVTGMLAAENLIVGIIGALVGIALTYAVLVAVGIVTSFLIPPSVFAPWQAASVALAAGAVCVLPVCFVRNGIKPSA